jgi:hypothetical protein
MERRFVVEAKEFLLSVKVGSSVIRLEEKIKSFLGVATLGSLCSAWLVDKMKEVLRSLGIEDFVKSGRFLEVASFAIGSRKGFIWLADGRDGRGWRQVVGELSKMVAFLGSLGGAGANSVGEKLQLSLGGFFFEARTKKGGVAMSYTEAVRGIAGVSTEISAMSGPKTEMREMNLLPMSLCRVEEDLRVAVDCFELMEKITRLTEKKSTSWSYGGGKSREMNLDNPRFSKVLLRLLKSRLLRSVLDRVAASVAQLFGPGLKPKLSLDVKCTQVGFKPILKKKRGAFLVGHVVNFAVVEFGSGLGMESISGTCPNVVSDLGSKPGLGSDLGPQFSFLSSGFSWGIIGGWSKAFC